MAAVLLGLGVLTWPACDKIADDEMREVTDKVAPNDTLPGWQGKTVVLEDFTGVGCVNCPNAADIAHNLQLLMKDRLILVELHAETPQIGENLVAPQVEGDVDLRSADAKEYSLYWNVPGLPAGLINRQQATGKALARGRWEAAARAVYEEMPVATIEATATLSDGQIAVSAKGAFSQAYECKDVRVMAMVLEDGFSVTQLTPSGAQAGYAHNHVLRKTLDEAWGKTVLTAAPAMGTTFEYESKASVESNWNPANLSVAVMVCNGETKEILNATKVSLN